MRFHNPPSTFPHALLPLSHEAIAGCQWQLIANINSMSSIAVPVVGRIFSISRVPLTVVGCRVLRECRDSYIHRIVANANIIAVSTQRQELR
jgi:CO dehydrogenase/acetyl-CoA synthase epsilon subunit